MPTAQGRWLGGVTDTAGQLLVALSTDASGTIPVQARVYAGATLAATSSTVNATSANSWIVVLPFSGLSPDTAYTVRVFLGGVEDVGNGATFRTTPIPGTPTSHVTAFAGCNRYLTIPSDRILAKGPRQFLHLGDWHYNDVSSSNPDLYRDQCKPGLLEPTQTALYSTVPTEWVWDDHDSSGITAAVRVGARTAFNLYSPHHALPAAASPHSIFRSFVIGRVRYILLDGRSVRPSQYVEDAPTKTMLGAPQLAWFFDEMLAGAEAGQLLIVNVGMPWIAGPPVLIGDMWNAYSYERTAIADFVKAHGLADRLIFIHSDAHMLAADSGVNNNYATGGGASWPVYCAGPLNNTTSTKGGPYSVGTYAPAGQQQQYATLDVADTGGETISVTYRGYDSADVVRRTHTSVRTVGPYTGSPPASGVVYDLEYRLGTSGSWLRLAVGLSAPAASAAPFLALPAASYQWRVVGRDSVTGHTAPASAARTVVVVGSEEPPDHEPPTIVHDLAIQAAALDPIAGAWTEILTGLAASTITGAQLLAAAGELAAGSYRWRVTGRDADTGHEAPASEHRTFVVAGEPVPDDVILIPHPLVDGALALTGEIDAAAAIAAMAHEATTVLAAAITFYDQDLRLMPFPSRIYGDNDIAGRIDLAALDPVTWGSGKAAGKTVTVFWASTKTLAATAIAPALSMTAPETVPGVSGVYTYSFDGAAITDHLVGGFAGQPVYLIVRVGQNYRVFAQTTPDAETRPVGV